MADPITIIGTVGALANIVDLVSKTIKSMRDLQGRWKQADLAFLSLAAQLTALRAALQKIQQWSDGELAGDPDYQLIMDLDVSISCCRLLIGKFDEFFFKLDQSTDDRFDFKGKVKFVFGTGELEDVQRMVERQIGALTLLLTACNCETISQQQKLLRDSQTRKVIGRIELDTASLIVHRDSSSFISRWSDNFSKFSIRFDFDKDLFITQVYERAFRNFMKSSTTSRRPDPVLRNTYEASSYRRELMEAKVKSQVIDQEIGRDKMRRREECKILLVGAADSGKMELVANLKMMNGDVLSKDELLEYRDIIRQKVVDYAKILIEGMMDDDILPELSANHDHYELLLRHFDTPALSIGLSQDSATAIYAIWKDPCNANFMGSTHALNLASSAPHLFDNVERIAAPAFIPTHADVLIISSKSKGVTKTDITIADLSVQIIDIDATNFSRNKWIHQFEDMMSILFVVDLTCYDRVVDPINGNTAMLEQIILFGSIVNSRWFSRTSIIVILNNAEGFKAKLAQSPLSTHFPAYGGGNDVERAALHLLHRFRAFTTWDRLFYSHISSHAQDTSIRGLVHAALNDTIRDHNLRLSGLI